MKRKLTTNLLIVLIVANFTAGGFLYYFIAKSRSGFVSDSKISREEKILENAIRTDPNNYKTRLLLGKRYLYEEHYNEAIEQFEQVLKIQPKNEEAFVRMANAYYENKERDQALKWFLKEIEVAEKKQFAKLDLNLLEAYFFTGKIYLEKKKPEKALPYLEKATKMDKKDADSFYLLGKAYYQTKKYNQSLKITDKALELIPDFADAMLLKALIYKTKGDEAKARVWAQKTLLADPESEEAQKLIEEL